MKRKIAILLAASLLLMTGCNNQSNEPSESSDTLNTSSAAQDSNTAESTNAPESSAPASEAPTETEAEITAPEGMDEEAQRKFMIENSLMTMGDTSRMVNVMKKAANGEEITVGFIGGSITEGIGAGADLCWAKLTYDALCEMFPDTKINYVNAGLSGTPSILGVVRAERDLFGEKNPDIVFIEFAVNDGGEQMNKNCYESLVKKSLGKENDPAVVLLFTVLKNRYSCQPWMKTIGDHYKLPMISVGNVINPMFDAGYMEWEKYSDDESHPNVWGHELVKDFIVNYFEQVKAIAEETAEAPTIPALPDSALYSDDYADMEFVGNTDLNVESVEGFTAKENVATSFDGWTYRGKNGGSVTFTAEFKTLFLVFYCNNLSYLTDAEVIIDGESVISLPSNKPGGWGNPEADLAWSGEGGQHTVEIKIAPSESSSMYSFAGIGIVK